MAKYKITFKRSVKKDLRSIPSRDVQRILKKVLILANDPRAEGTIKLTKQNYYRIRVGLYRIICKIQDLKLVVQVIKIAHRSKVYKDN